MSTARSDMTIMGNQKNPNDPNRQNQTPREPDPGSKQQQQWQDPDQQKKGDKSQQRPKDEPHRQQS